MSKGSRNRVTDKKAYDSSPLWDHVEKKRKAAFAAILKEKKQWKKQEDNK